MDMQAVRSVLLDEARELLGQMEAALLAVEACGPDPEHINAIFRAAHTLKGSSGMFNLTLVVEFTHLMENLLVRVRAGQQSIDSDVISLLLRCGDYLQQLFTEVGAGFDDKDPDPALRAQLISALETVLGETSPLPVVNDAANPAPRQAFRIHLKPEPQVFLHGLDPLAFINYLGSKATLSKLCVLEQALPALSALDAESCYLGFELELEGELSRADIEQALEFLADDCAIEIHALTHPDAVVDALPVSAEPSALTTAVAAPDAHSSRHAEQVLIKVDARKLDQLIDAVGELVTRSARSRTLAEHAPREAVKTFMEEVDSFVEQIRDRALSLRMAPINEVFQRFPRVVRDVAQDLGKQVELAIQGADTELDKSMIDQLADPLLHIVRNALDHGIEPCEERLTQGKNPTATLSLKAYHESGAVIVEIRDDGRGLNAERIQAKAIERGLISAEDELSEQAIFNLIFAAGFSTAEKVTDLSGRGVGMDVVKRGIEALRGHIDIQSQAGVGTTFRIRLPLTLSIIDGFQVVVGDAHFVIPLSQVVECLELGEHTGNNQIMSLRSTPLAFVRLAELFALPRDPHSRECLVVVQHGNQRTGIVVDRFAGELQAVIKPLNPLLRGVKGLGGSTILGDGSVAMILDINALLDTERSKSI